jgi:hypothetical protein
MPEVGKALTTLKTSSFFERALRIQSAVCKLVATDPFWPQTIISIMAALVLIIIVREFQRNPMTKRWTQISGRNNYPTMKQPRSGN